MKFPDFSAIGGQQHVKRAMEIAVAGGHSLLLIGAPGTGKTFLLGAFFGLWEQAAESPHCTVEKSQEGSALTYTTNIGDRMIEAAEGLPCPCGRVMDNISKCFCDLTDVLKHRDALPYRHALHLQVSPPSFKDLTSLISVSEKERLETTQQVAVRVREAWRFQASRFGERYLNADMDNIRAMECLSDEEINRIMKNQTDRQQLSLAAFFDVLRVARTIADLNYRNVVRPMDVSEALIYRETVSRKED
jgi:magnesium chelatase family protein